MTDAQVVADIRAALFYLTEATKQLTYGTSLVEEAKKYLQDALTRR